MTRNRSLTSHFTPLRDGNKSVYRTCAELLVYTGRMDPSEVTAMLGILPTKIVVAGKKGPVNKLGRSPVGKVNGWFLSSEQHVKSKDLRRHLDWLIGQLRDARERLQKLQSVEGVRMYVFCPWWSRYGGGGPTLWPDQMGGLAELDLECTIAFADYSEKEVSKSIGKKGTA